MPVLDKAKELIAHITSQIARLEASANACAACAERRAQAIKHYRSMLDKLRGR